MVNFVIIVITRRCAWIRAHNSLATPLQDAALAGRSRDRLQSSADDHHLQFNPSMATVKPQSNGPLYSNTVIGILAVDGWAVTFGTARRGLLYQM